MDYQFYTPEEFGKILHIHRRTVYQWINEGVINAVKLGKRGILRIPMTEIDRILQMHSKELNKLKENE